MPKRTPPQVSPRSLPSERPLGQRAIHQGRAPKLDRLTLRSLWHQIPAWKLGVRLSRTLVFPDFKEAMAFLNRVARLADSENHHPDVSLRYNQLTLTLWTHDAGGLTENDLVLAAKIDRLLER